MAEEWSPKIDHASLDGKACHFTIAGSVTGEDGEGYSTNRFVSRSGRVILEPDDWNLGYCVTVFKRSLPENQVVTWRAVLSGTDAASPPAAMPGAEASVTVAQGLPAGRHTLELRGDGMAETVQAVRFYSPSGAAEVMK